MAANQLVRLNASPTVSPEPPGTTVAFLASIDFNNQPVNINTGDITKGIQNLVFSLSNPVAIGSLDDFIDYLNRALGVPLTSQQLIDFIDQIPDTPAFLLAFRNALLKIASTPIWITVLNINVAAGQFTLGVSFPIDLQLTSFLTINSIGVMVNKTGTTQ
jgi:hypothetical protein